jgi:hypothetical protein
MARKITKFQSENGKEFDNEIEADIEDVKHQITNYVRGEFVRDMDSEMIANTIIENCREFHTLLGKLTSLKNKS